MRHCLLYRNPAHVTRVAVERLFSPFSQQITGPDISKYPLREAINNLSITSKFTVQVNGVVGDATVLEDFFLSLLTGFDLSNPRVLEVDANGACASGVLLATHSRNFLGWRPQPSGGLSFHIPFVAKPEGMRHAAKYSHLTLRMPLQTPLRDAGCPESIVDCVHHVDAVKMLVALRRANVRPEMISERALRCALGGTDAARDLLGVL